MFLVKNSTSKSNKRCYPRIICLYHLLARAPQITRASACRIVTQQVPTCFMLPTRGLASLLLVWACIRNGSSKQNIIPQFQNILIAVAVFKRRKTRGARFEWGEVDLITIPISLLAFDRVLSLQVIACDKRPKRRDTTESIFVLY